MTSNNISSLGSNSNKKNTNICHETVIFFQCIQIRKVELVKLLRLSWSTGELEVKFSQMQYQTMNEFETLRNCNVFGMQEASSSVLTLLQKSCSLKLQFHLFIIVKPNVLHVDCKSGYVVIMRKDTSEFEDLQRRGPELGQVHGVIYRKAFGESCKHKNVVGEGFGIINRESKIISGAFNLSCNLTKGNNMYHDDTQVN